MKEAGRRLLAMLVASPAFQAFWKATYLRKKTVVLMYHEILPDSHDIESWLVVKQSEFRFQMEYLSRHFEVVSLQTAMECMTAGKHRGENLAVVTFDDGYSGNRTAMLPVVEELGIPVTVFVATGAIQNQNHHWFDQVMMVLLKDCSGDMVIDLKRFKLSQYSIPSNLMGEARWKVVQEILEQLKTLPPALRAKAVNSILEQGSASRPNGQSSRPALNPLTIRELQDLAASPLVTIGAHSHNHDILVQLKEKDIAKSVGKSKRLLELWTKRKVRHFAYPNGDVNDAVKSIVKQLGFVSGVTTVTKPWNAGRSFFEIPRIGIGRFDSLNTFKASVSGAGILCNLLRSNGRKALTMLRALMGFLTTFLVPFLFDCQAGEFLIANTAKSDAIFSAAQTASLMNILYVDVALLPMCRWI